MADRYQDIYAHRADLYDQLVSAEDTDGQLLPGILAQTPLAGKRVLEVGAGTGRLTRLMSAQGARVIASELAPAMLALGHRLVPQASWVLADARALPFAPAWADLAVAGWVFGHFRSWWPEDWRARVEDALDALTAALRPGGRLMIIETLGTGSASPAPPSPALAEYCAWLENVRRLTRRAIRTDYAFPDVETAAQVCGAFFGADLAERIRTEGWSRVPECTGIWVARQ